MARAYASLLRRNPRIRRLWLGQVVSELGDWISLVALLQIVARVKPGATSEADLLGIEMIPPLVLAPVAGLLADRLDRRRILIAADLCRAATAIGFLLAGDRVGLLFALVFLQFSFTAFFEPARQALVPAYAEGEDLVTANALLGVTWSVVLAVGGFAGGVITHLVDPHGAFLVDSASFLLSAGILIGLPPSPPPPRAEGEQEVSWREAARTVAARPRLLSALVVKAGMAVSGGALWLLSALFGQQIFPIGHGGAISTGYLYAAHGGGSLIGAVLTRPSMFRGGGASAVTAIGVAFSLRCVFFGLLAAAPNLAVACVAVVGISACGSFLWVASSTLIAELSPESMRGRLFAADFAGLMLLLAASIWWTGAAVDRVPMSAPAAAAGTAVLAALVGGAWALPWVKWKEWGEVREVAR